MIVSRTAELARLDALLAALVRGEGGALVVHGEAGIGKTTLLEALIQRCGDVESRWCGPAGPRPRRSSPSPPWPTARHLADAETAGLVRLAEGRVTFAHPLIRGQVYREARAADRRGAHVALAAVLPEDDDRRAWHLAAAAVAPDEAVAATLERVGGQAMARRAYAAGSDALERAARLSPEPAAAGRRMITEAAAARGLLQTFQLAEDVGHRHMAGWALTIRTRILAAQGRPQESRAAAATALAIAESDRISTGLR